MGFWCVGKRVRARIVVAGVLVWAGLVAGVAVAQGLPPALQSVFQKTGLNQGDVSIVVQELNGPRLISINPELPRNPASVMKTVTTWAGLSALGPEYRWRTAFYLPGPQAVDAQGTVRGPIYLKAGGDPLLQLQDLWMLLRELRLRGIKNLTEVVVDRSMFGDVAIDPDAFDDSGDRPYNASPDALMVSLGALRLSFQPDMRHKKWVPVIDPPVPGVRVEGQIGWSDAPCPGSPSVATHITPTQGGAVITVGGKAAGSCGEFSIYRLVLSQPDNFEAVFRVIWKELGGTLGRGFKAGVTPRNAVLLAWHDSDTLADTIRQINKYSNNVMARTLLLTLGAEQSGPGATPQTGAQAALSVLQRQGVDTRGWVIDNGSGLSRNGRLTAAGLAGLLNTAWNSPMMSEFMSSLAIAGVDGTVRRRLRDDEARGMAHLKTGTLRDTRAMAGYVQGVSGKRYLMVSFAEGERSWAVRSFDDALVRWLSEQ